MIVSIISVSIPYPVTTKDVIERIARTPLMHDLGEKYTYGFGIDIAGYLAEVLSGKTLDALIRERIFEPLGMNDTYFYVPRDKHNRIVKLYREADNKSFTFVADAPEQSYPFETDRLFHGGGGGLSGTIEDYARFCQMILNKGMFNNHRVLGRKTVEMMCVNHLIDVKEDYPFEWGLGFEITTRNNHYIGTMASELESGFVYPRWKRYAAYHCLTVAVVTHQHASAVKADAQSSLILIVLTCSPDTLS